MNAGQIVTLILQGILVIGYVVGTIIIKNHQNKKIEALETGINTQSKIMESMQRFMGMFDLDQVEKYVKMSQKTFKFEKAEALKKLNEDWKKEADKSISFLIAEREDLLSLAISLIWTSPYSSALEKSINEMKSDKSKVTLLSTMKISRKAIDEAFKDLPGWFGEYLRSHEGGAPKKE